MRIFDPEEHFIQQWNKIFVLCSVIAVSLDPLFLYIPVIDASQKCIGVDKKLENIACILRSFTDIFYILHIIFQFRIGFIAPSSRIVGGDKLVTDPNAIAKRYLSSYFIIDILAALPLPQVAVLLIIPNINQPVSLITKNLLKFIIFIQYIPRLLRIPLLYNNVTRTSGGFIDAAWARAATNLFFYMLASHVLGAVWYLFSIERKETCWLIACERYNCDAKYLYCGEDRVGEIAFLNASCPLLERNEIKDDADFNFGIFLDALQSRVAEKRNLRKIFYCSWWGLQNLSSLGQSLKTSTSVWEILFADLISILGLVLFSLLIGNMQKYLQTYSLPSLRAEEMKEKRRDARYLMSHYNLPPSLREQVLEHEQFVWQRTRGVDLESFVQNLPRDLRRSIKRHLCLVLLRRVPIFENMDAQLWDAMCDRLKLVFYTKGSFIIREGDPVEEMHFILQGEVKSVTLNSAQNGFFHSTHFNAGDFFGEELIPWIWNHKLKHSLPTSTIAAQSTTNVQAYTLTADDLKFVASQFPRLVSKDLRQNFRFYSQQWRTWAACFIQAAWRKHYQWKFETSFRKHEVRLLGELSKGKRTPSEHGAAIYASRFAVNILRARQRNRRSAAAPLKPFTTFEATKPDI